MTPAALKALSSGDMENFIAASTPGGIEAQEKRGQLEQAEKQTLPTKLREGREPYEKLGFVFGGPTGDGIFQEVTFPAGWKKVPTDHDMWTDIVDDKGRKRGGIFYKAAFYDRSAHADLSARFGVGRDYSHEWPDVIVRVFDAAGIVDKQVSGLPKEDWSGDRDVAMAAGQKQDAAIEELREWLNAEYPEWRDVTKHWD